jgi:hypothetical protein
VKEKITAIEEPKVLGVAQSYIKQIQTSLNVDAQIHRLTEERAKVIEKITAIEDQLVLMRQIQTSLNELQAHHVSEMMCMPSQSVDLIRVCQVAHFLLTQESIDDKETWGEVWKRV